MFLGWGSLLAPPTLAWLGGWRRALAGRNIWKPAVVTLSLQEFGEWRVGICLSSPRAVSGFGAPLVLGVQPGVAVQEGGALGRVKEQGAMPPCFRMLVLFCLGVGHGWCLGIFHTRKGWTAW